MSTSPKYFRPEAAADHHQVSVTRIRELAREGKVRRFIDPTDRRKTLYDASDLDRCFSELDPI